MSNPTRETGDENASSLFSWTDLDEFNIQVEHVYLHQIPNPTSAFSLETQVSVSARISGFSCFLGRSSLIL